MQKQIIESKMNKLLMKYFIQPNSSFNIERRRQMIDHNATSFQKWQEFAKAQVKLERRQQFIDQIKTLLNSYFVLKEYSAIHPISLDLKKIITVQINPYAEHQQIIDEFNVITTKRIRQSLYKAKSIQEYLLQQIYFIIDILQRRVKLIDYFNILVQVSKDLYNYAATFTMMTFADFTFILHKFVQPNDIILYLLAQQSVPIPIVFTANQTTKQNSQLLLNILGRQKYFFIINIWSEKSFKTIGSMKGSGVLSKVMQIDPRYFIGSSFQNVINLYKLKKNGRNILLIDYIGKNDGKINPLIQILAISTIPLILFHIDEKDLIQDESLNFLKYYQSIVQEQKVKRMYVCQNISSKIYDIKKALAKVHQTVRNQSIFRFQTPQSNLSHFSKALQEFFALNKQANLTDFSKQLKLKSFLNNQKVNVFLKPKLQDKKQQLIPMVFLENQINKIRTNKKTYNFQQILQKNIARYFPNKDTVKSILRIIQQSQKQYMQHLRQLTQKQKQLKKKLLQQNIPIFTQSCMTFLSKEHIQIQQFVSGLIQEQNHNLTSKLQLLNKNISEQVQRSKEYKAKKKQILQGRITFDNIIQQISINNQLAKDISKNNQSTLYDKFIDQYYTKSLNSQSPFNLIDGQSSNFGNSGLQKFFQQLFSKNEEKDIFVISVIGPKASGKSTLINYLFHYNIHLREDQFARGVYVGFCQISNKIIVVLDTSGIMEIDFKQKESALIYSAQQLGRIFATFDHQIASIVMKQSQLVIFTGFVQQQKRIIPQALELVVAVCFKVLAALQVNNYGEKNIITPKRIMFALNKSSQTTVLNKKQALSLMMNNLKPILSLQDQSQENPRKIFQQQMRLQAEDIFQLPSIYQNDSMVLNQAYGFKILGLRKSILKHLDALSKYRLNTQKLIKLYKDAKIDWQTIMLTGKNIVKSQSPKQLQYRQIVHTAYHQKYSAIQKLMIDRIDKLLPLTKFDELTFSNYQVSQYLKRPSKSSYTSWNIFSIKLDQYLKKIYQKSSNSSNSQYQTTILQCEKVVQDWTRDKVDRIQRFSDLYVSHIKRLFDSIFYTRIKRYFSEFQIIFKKEIQNVTFQKIYEIIRNLNKEKKISKVQRDLIYTRQTSQFLKGKYFEQKKKEVAQEQLKVVFTNLLSSENIFTKELGISHVNDVIDFDQKINGEYQKNINQFLAFEDQSQIKDHIKYFGQLINNYVRLTQQKLTQLYSETNKIILINIQSEILHIKEQIVEGIVARILADIQKKSALIYQKMNASTKNRSIQMQRQISKELQQIQIKLTQKQNQAKKLEQKMQIEVRQDYKSKLVEIQQVIGFIEREQAYLSKLKDKYNDKAINRSKITLRKINFKILLIAKIFKQIFSIFYGQRQKEIELLVTEFNNQVNNRRALIIWIQVSTRASSIDNQRHQKQKYEILMYYLIYSAVQDLDDKSIKLEKAVDDDLAAIKLKWKNTFIVNLRRIYKEKTVVNQPAGGKSNNITSILDNTLNNEKIHSKNTPPQEMKAIFIQCAKFIINPRKYLFFKQLNSLYSSTQKDQMNKQAFKQIEDKIEQIIRFDQKVSVDQIKKFFKSNNFLNIQSCIARQSFFNQSEAIFYLIKKLQEQRQSIKEQIISNADKKQIIQSIAYEIYVINHDMIGCGQTCPFCGSICKFQKKHSGNHSAYHTIMAFGGCRDQKNQFLLRNCSQILNKQYWSQHHTIFRSHQQLLQGFFNRWRKDFSTNTQTKESQNVKYLKIWANIQKLMIQVFSNRYNGNIRPFQSTNQEVKKERLKKIFLTQEDYKNPENLTNYWQSS